MARPRSDLGRLMHKDVILNKDQDNQTTSVLLHFREPKEGQVKSVMLGRVQDPDLCLVRTLETYPLRTATLREVLPSDHTLFLAYIMDATKVTLICPSTLSSWVKRLMGRAGVDPAYKAHSIRSAASTKAVTRGQSIQAVKKHANWSLNTNKFESFYYKPVAAASSSTQISNSILQAENSITLSAEARETEIVLGTTNNQDVSRAEANNVINATP